MAQIRRAGPRDAEGLAFVHIRTWRIAYAGLLPAETLARLSLAARTRRWERILREDANPTWVAVEAGRVVGFASSGRGRDADVPTPSELYALYLDPDHHGSGIADDLIGAAVGDGPASLWVLAGNERAIRFYTRHGFAPDGAEKVEQSADGTPMHELRMVRHGSVAD